MGKINRVYLYLLFMELLVAYQDDPAGRNMAEYLSHDMDRDDCDYDGAQIWRSRWYDLMTIPTPAISADWLAENSQVLEGEYDGFVFLSRHSAESGVLALTCHSTGNFGEARFGGRDREVAVPHPHLQRAYLRRLYENRELFSGFDVTIEATHHGPTSLDRPTLFIEIGTTQKQWENKNLCSSVATIVHDTLTSKIPDSPTAICIGGTHYPARFTDELLHGSRSLGTVVPKRAVSQLDEDLFCHILKRNNMASEILLDWNGISGPDKRRLEELLPTAGGLAVSRI